LIPVITLQLLAFIVYLSLSHNLSPWNLQFVYFMLDNNIFLKLVYVIYCILDSYLQPVLCMHVYMFDVYSYTITHLPTNIIVIYFLVM